MAHCLIGLGSNLGDRSANLGAARGQLSGLPQSSLTAFSSLHESKAAGGPATQASYLNAAALIETSLPPLQLLHELQAIENRLGRIRTERWGPRTIDLDLLLYDQEELESPELTLPHPRMSFRRFVLEPAAEIAKEMVYPINGWTIEKLLKHINHPYRFLALAVDPRWNEQAGTDLLKALAAHPLVSQPETADSTRPMTVEDPWTLTDYWKPLYLFPHPIAKGELIQPIPQLFVAWHPSRHHLPELDRARRHPISPPCLWIPGITLNQAKQEVIAAMTAME